MLLMLTIRIGKSVFYYYNPDLSGVFLQIGLSACILIGPSLFFYIKSSISPDSTSINHWKYHFLILFTGVVVFGIYYPWHDHPLVWVEAIFVIYGVWLAYIVASGVVLYPIFKTLFFKTKDIKSIEFWLISVYVGNVMIWIAYRSVAFVSYIAGALTFTFVFFLLVVLIVFHSKGKEVFGGKEKYSNKKIDADEAEELNEKLLQLMQEEELYKDANLKLPDVAKKIHVLPHTISQFLNDNLDQSFTTFINRFRIEHAKKMIEDEDNLSLESIGYACGFNSKSTFYSAFKKQTKTTPAQFREGL